MANAMREPQLKCSQRGGKREEEENRKRERETGLRTTATPFWRPVRRVLKVLFRFGAMRQKSFTTADRDRERGGGRE